MDLIGQFFPIGSRGNRVFLGLGEVLTLRDCSGRGEELQFTLGKNEMLSVFFL